MDTGCSSSQRGSNHERWQRLQTWVRIAETMWRLPRYISGGLLRQTRQQQQACERQSLAREIVGMSIEFKSGLHSVLGAGAEDELTICVRHDVPERSKIVVGSSDHGAGDQIIGKGTRTKPSFSYNFKVFHQNKHCLRSLRSKTFTSLLPRGMIQFMCNFKHHDFRTEVRVLY
ncbi:hypothetical protein C1H46_023130 [Malus baccata]|uniref:Uncharacterized protein n=1 Tax=Malus baccata TaxID=106549 RepID=A0A540LY09_MALBA|nr:hypothetical protein C1H46_023130 [Malus baccata]